MERRIVLWIVIGVMFIATLILVFKAGATGLALGASETASSASSASYGQMVGGC